MISTHQVTEWGHPREMIQTATGPMHYDIWCQVEAGRWANKWRTAHVRVNSEGLIALFTDSTDMKPVPADDPK